MSTTTITVLAAPVDVTPSTGPAFTELTKLVSGLLAYAGLAALAAILLGGIAWGLGERLGFDRAGNAGKMGVLAGLGLGFLSGAAVALVGAFVKAGGGTFNLAIAADTASAPLYDKIKPIVGWLISYGSLAAIATVVLGGIGWAIGERIGLERMSMVGKVGVWAGLGMGLLTGASVTLVNFMINTGTQVA